MPDDGLTSGGGGLIPERSRHGWKSRAATNLLGGGILLLLLRIQGGLQYHSGKGGIYVEFRLLGEVQVLFRFFSGLVSGFSLDYRKGGVYMCDSTFVFICSTFICASHVLPYRIRLGYLLLLFSRVRSFIFNVLYPKRSTHVYLTVLYTALLPLQYVLGGWVRY